MRLNMARVRKELLINRVVQQASGPNAALVAVANLGNLSSADKFKVRYGLEGAGASVNFTKNTLTAKALDGLGPEAQSLAPLLRGRTLLTCGPAEVPLAKQLLALEKQLPGFYVLGALLNSQRILQVRAAHPHACLPHHHPRPHATSATPAASSCRVRHMRCTMMRLTAQVQELDRLAKLPPLDQVHAQMVASMMPGAALQVPNVAAYLVSVLQMRVEALQDEASGGGAASGGG